MRRKFRGLGPAFLFTAAFLHTPSLSFGGGESGDPDSANSGAGDSAPMVTNAVDEKLLKVLAEINQSQPRTGLSSKKSGDIESDLQRDDIDALLDQAEARAAFFQRLLDAIPDEITPDWLKPLKRGLTGRDEGGRQNSSGGGAVTQANAEPGDTASDAAKKADGAEDGEIRIFVPATRLDKSDG